MTIHARVQYLSAAAIDVRLTPAEQTELTIHLATCRACRIVETGYRADAAALHAIAFAQPPARIRSAVLAATRRPPARDIHPWRLLAVATLLFGALLGAALAIGAWNSRPVIVQVVPVVPPSGQPSTSAAPIPSPVAEPPGDLLLFRAREEGGRNGTAWIAHAAGGSPRALGPASEASWAADGQSIHLVSQNSLCVPTLTSVSVDGRVLGAIQAGLRAGDGAFAWSPDGRQVAFARFHNGEPKGSCGSQGGVYPADASLQDIMVMDADGGGQRVLVPTLWPARPFSWSPDGTRIAYSNTATNEKSLLDPIVVRLSDGRQTSMTEVALDGAASPRWSPDGTRLAVPLFIDGIAHVGVITIDGIHLQGLGDGDVDAQGGSWSPDGASIAVAFDIVSSDFQVSPGGIRIHTADGTAHRDLALADIESFTEPPAWSFDGAWLAYIRTTSDGAAGGAGVALILADGSARRELPGTAGVQWVAWQSVATATALTGEPN
jgi:Tol biopolymer transport system component